MQIAVREFKNRLSELLKRAEAGEEIVVTSHGRPVARLGPVAACAPPDPVASLRRLRSQPWLRPATANRSLPRHSPCPPSSEHLFVSAVRTFCVSVDSSRRRLEPGRHAIQVRRSDRTDPGGGPTPGASPLPLRLKGDDR